MDANLFHILTWVLGALGALLLFLFGLWWKIENRQDRKIDESAKSNDKDHRELQRGRGEGG